MIEFLKGVIRHERLISPFYINSVSDSPTLIRFIQKIKSLGFSFFFFLGQPLMPVNSKGWLLIPEIPRNPPIIRKLPPKQCPWEFMKEQIPPKYFKICANRCWVTCFFGFFWTAYIFQKFSVVSLPWKFHECYEK